MSVKNNPFARYYIDYFWNVEFNALMYIESGWNISCKVRQLRNCHKRFTITRLNGHSWLLYLRFVQKFDANNDSVFLWAVLETNRLTIWIAGPKLVTVVWRSSIAFPRSRDRKVFRKPTFLVSRAIETTLFARVHLLWVQIAWQATFPCLFFFSFFRTFQPVL